MKDRPEKEEVLVKVVVEMFKNVIKEVEIIGDKIMNAIQDFAAKQKDFNTRLATALDDISAEIKTLNDLITTLQNSSGPITPEDQATLDALQASGEQIAEKAEALDIKPPTPPTA